MAADESLGARLIAELRRRGEYGMYFQYDAYQALPLVDSIEKLKRLLQKAGYPTVVASEDVVQVANGLKEANGGDDLPLFVAHSDPTGIFGLLYLLLGWLYSFLRVRPEFPTEQRPATDYLGNPLD